jgi:hypothetical protein
MAPPFVGPVMRRRALGLFAPLAVLAIICLFAVFGAAQHVYRSSANDPQYQMAEDAAHRLDVGFKPADVATGQKVDIGGSLAPFVAIYDAQGNALAATLILDNQTPTPPQGVLDTAQSKGVDVITWEPRAGVRMAIVAVRWRGGTVVAGRSLALVEQRTSDLFALLVIGGVATLVVLFVVCLVAVNLMATEDETAVADP